MDPLSQLQDEQKKRFARMKMKEAVTPQSKTEKVSDLFTVSVFSDL